MCKVFFFFFCWRLRFVFCSLLKFAFTGRERVARSCQIFVAARANWQRSLPRSIFFLLVVFRLRVHTGRTLVVVRTWCNFLDVMWCQSAMHSMFMFTNRVGVLFLLIPVREMMRKVPIGSRQHSSWLPLLNWTLLLEQAVRGSALSHHSWLVLACDVHGGSRVRKTSKRQL